MEVMDCLVVSNMGNKWVKGYISYIKSGNPQISWTSYNQKPSILWTSELFSISYMGCHPKPIDEVHHFSRWLKPHHQPVEFMNHFVSAGLTFNLDTPRPIQETFSPWLWHMTRDMLRCSSTIFFLSEFFQVDEQANELVQRWE
jgi:hypothetical protein